MISAFAFLMHCAPTFVINTALTPSPERPVEFLEVLRDNAAFSNNEKAAISEFLESVDLLEMRAASRGARMRFKFCSRSPSGSCAGRVRRKLSLPNDRRKSVWF